jgi:hypothetical protein
MLLPWLRIRTSGVQWVFIFAEPDVWKIHRHRCATSEDIEGPVSYFLVLGLERGPLTISLVRTTEELLGRNSSGCGQENRDSRPGGIRRADHATSSIRKSWHCFANKRLSLGGNSSLADQSHGVFFYSNFLLSRIIKSPFATAASRFKRHIYVT